MRSLRSLTITAALLGLAASANAASISLSTDKNTYSVGETITLSVTADGEGESILSIVFGVSYDGNVITGPATAQSQQVVLQLAGSLDVGDGFGFESIMNQSNIFAGSAVGVVTATAQFVAGDYGSTRFTTGIGPYWGSEVFTFGSATPGAMSNEVIVPEPATAALLGLGLAGLAARGRRYSA